LFYLFIYFKSKIQVGIIGSSTPFINGHPHTLFLNDVCYSHGTLGVALSSKKTQFSSYLSSTGTLLGEKIKVLNSKGNLIHDVNDKLNPTQKLINAIKQRQLNPQKDEQFYLAVYDSDSDSNSNASVIFLFFFFLSFFSYSENLKKTHFNNRNLIMESLELQVEIQRKE